VRLAFLGRWCYLASAQTFERVRRMQARNLIVPVVGDFAGPKALRAIGDWLRECATLRPKIRTPVAGPIGPVMAAFRNGRLAT
jgi:hypothetical protein